MAVFLAKHPLVAKYDLSSVQRALTGAAPLGDTVQEEFIEKIGIQMLQGVFIVYFSYSINFIRIIPNDFLNDFNFYEYMKVIFSTERCLQNKTILVTSCYVH